MSVRGRGVRTRRRDGRVRRAARSIVRASGGRLDDPNFRVTVQGLGRTHVLVNETFEKLRELGLIDDAGELRSNVIDTFTRLVALELKLCTALGLTPASLGKVTKERAIDLATAMSAEVVDAEPS